MATAQKPISRAALTDGVIIAVAKLVDDAQKETREPSHSEIEFQISRAGLSQGDPVAQGQRIGKAKRVRGTLNWALEHSPDGGERLVSGIVTLVRGCGGFRAGNPNYVGEEAIQAAADAFAAEGYRLSEDGHLAPEVLESLTGKDLVEALKAQVTRAKRGVTDAALLIGTSKDLLESAASHVLTECFGSYSTQANFPTLLGQAFMALDLSTSHDPPTPGEKPQKRMERALYDLGCAVNGLRNKEGTGHGRPWVTGVTQADARIAAEGMGVVTEYLLNALEKWSAARSHAAIH